MGTNIFIRLEAHIKFVSSIDDVGMSIKILLGIVQQCLNTRNEKAWNQEARGKEETRDSKDGEAQVHYVSGAHLKL